MNIRKTSFGDIVSVITTTTNSCISKRKYIVFMSRDAPNNDFGRILNTEYYKLLLEEYI